MHQYKQANLIIHKQENMIEDSARNKRTNLAVKKLIKFQERKEKCQELILMNEIFQAIEQLTDLIKVKEFLDANQFTGIGNNQKWKFNTPSSANMWFKQICQEEQEVQKNLFDLLNISFAIQLQTSEMEAREIIKVYKDLMDAVGDRYELQIGLANIYYNNEDYLNAKQYYLKTIQKQSQCFKTFEYISWIFYKFDQVNEALQYCLKSLKINSDNPQALYLKIILESKFLKRELQLQDFFKKYPKYNRVYLHLGDAAQQPEEKLKYYNKILQYQPDSAYVTTKIAEVYFDLTNKDDYQYRQINLQKAESTVLKALKLSMNCSFSYQLLAKIYIVRKELDEAIKLYKRAIYFSPNTFNLYQEFGNFYLTIKKNYSKAIENFKKYLQLNPYSAHVHYLIGVTYNQIEHKTEAAQYFEKAVVIDPKHHKSLGSLAVLQQDQRNFPKSIELFSQAHYIQPKEGNYIYGLGCCYTALKCLKQAEEWTKKGLQLNQQKCKPLLCYLTAFIRFFENNNKQFLVWMLKGQSYRKRANTQIQYIIQFLADLLDPREMHAIIKQFALTLPNDIKDIYSLIHLAKLCKYLKIDRYQSLFALAASKLHQLNYISDEVEKVLESLMERKKRRM